ncbi:hypothetical protein [Salinigranum rubrum]|uniref:hypothetical protein n=1 Tax=Salinigranum rubrum TaxID=755307 RepID=UPI001FE2AC98|nr:hypothetical protein [Salinigranum rubrum]
MVETYPFHPELLELLDRLYEAGREQQSVRGAMNVLADTVSRKYDETDLIVTCDIRPAAFRGMNQTLFNRYVSDRDHVKDIDFGDDLLRTILLYTLDERSQMATVTQCLLGTFKPEKSSVDKLNMSLSSLYGTAHYLDRDSGGASYYITEDPKLTALVTREQNRVLEDDSASIEETLVDIVRNDVWDGDVLVHPNDDIPDNDSLSVVVTLSYLSNGTLEAELSEFFEGRTYQNTVLFVTPKKQLLEDEDIIKKAARVLGAQNLQGKVDDDKGELSRLIRDERRELTNELSDRYGKWVKWSVDPSGDLRMRRKNVAARVSDVENSVGRDKTYVSETILDEVEGTANGITLKSMKNDFKAFRRMPVLIDDNLFYSAVRKLYDDEKIVLEGDHAKFYVPHKGDRMPDLEDSLVIRHPDSLDDAIFEEEKTTTSTRGTEGGTGQTGGTTTAGTGSGGGGGSGTTSTGATGGGGGGTTIGTTSTTKNVYLEGNSGRVLRSMAESRISESEDTVTHIDLSYDLADLSKEELIEFLQKLPSANHIGADLVIESETDE